MPVREFADNSFHSPPIHRVERCAWNRVLRSIPKNQQLPPQSGNALTWHSTRRLASCRGALAHGQTMSAPPQLTFCLSGVLQASALLSWSPRDFNSLSCAVLWLDTFFFFFWDLSKGTHDWPGSVWGLHMLGFILVWPVAFSHLHYKNCSYWMLGSVFSTLLIMFKGSSRDSVTRSLVNILAWPRSRATSGGATVSTSVCGQRRHCIIENL